MSKKTLSILIDNKPAFTKPLLLNKNLIEIRKIIEKRTRYFLFLDKNENIIDTEDEEDMLLNDIISGDILKLKNDTTKDEVEINFYLDEKYKCKKSFSKKDNLTNIRKILKKEIKSGFLFLDKNSNTIDEEDENEMDFGNILNKGNIKLKSELSQSSDSEETNNTIEQSNKDNSEITIEKEKENEGTPPSPLEKKKTIKKVKNFDLSKYTLLTNTKGLSIYLYSNIRRISEHDRVFNYFFDQFDGRDLKDAYVVLFAGKTGDGKTTAINAFFNIIKGVTLKDNYRFKLIEEQKKTPGISQTDGIHLYYLKDYNDKPIIIIDSQGFADTRGIEEDVKTVAAFQYVFANTIDHINTICFISNATNARLDHQTKYIFSSVTQLFSEDLTDNFIVLATHANNQSMEEGPAFIESINQDAGFLEINKRMIKKWWYAFDSLSLFSHRKDELTQFSYEQMVALYEENIKKSMPKSIKKSSIILNKRKQLTIDLNELSRKFRNLILEQENLSKKEKAISEVICNIRAMEEKIKMVEEKCSFLNVEDQEKLLSELNGELNKQLNELSNQTSIKQIKILKISKCLHTHCEICKDNCHSTCDCWFSEVGRCYVYPVFGNMCERCGHHKLHHRQDNYYYGYESVTEKVDNTQAIGNAKNENLKKQMKIQEEINKKNLDRSNIEKQINDLKLNKEILIEKKKMNETEKDGIKEEILKITREILFTIFKLQKISQEINSMIMGPIGNKTQDDYIDSLQFELKNLPGNHDEQIAKLDKIKSNNKAFKEINQLKEDEIMHLNENELIKKLQNFIPQ